MDPCDAPAPPALELRSVVKRYGAGATEVRALTDVDFVVAPGELVAVMGPSGCGKSTLVHRAGALEDPDAGSVAVAGRDLSRLGLAERAALRRRDVGYVFQRLNLGERNADVAVTPPGATAMDALVVATDRRVGYYSDLLVTPAFLEARRLPTRVRAVAYRSDEPFTDEQRGELDDLLYEQGGEAPGSYQLFINEPDSGPSPFQVELLLSAVAVAFSVLVVAASLALAAAESRYERDVLTVAGAPPGTLARTAGAKAGLLSVLGGAMAIPIGFLPVVVVSLAIEDGFPLRPPWATVVLLVAAVPIAAALIARLASSTAQHLRPVRVSTATFE
ncbi:hypothetical protein BH18ACT1_BH18ACT1_09880 [soil metagenome]